MKFSFSLFARYMFFSPTAWCSDNVRIPREDMDQVHLPDPVKNDIDTLKQETERLAAAMEAWQEQAAAFQVWQETCNKT